MKNDLYNEIKAGFEARHLLVTAVSLLSALIASFGEKTTWFHWLLNLSGGFIIAGVTGMLLIESGWGMWWGSGAAYLAGQIGNRVVNVLVKVTKLAEVDPFGIGEKIVKLVRSVLALVWSWKTKNFSDEEH